MRPVRGCAVVGSWNCDLWAPLSARCKTVNHFLVSFASPTVVVSKGHESSERSCAFCYAWD